MSDIQDYIPGAKHKISLTLDAVRHSTQTTRKAYNDMLEALDQEYRAIRTFVLNEIEQAENQAKAMEDAILSFSARCNRALDKASAMADTIQEKDEVKQPDTPKPPDYREMVDAVNRM